MTLTIEHDGNIARQDPSLDALTRLGEKRARLETQVTDALKQNIVNMTGAFSSVRHIPTQSREMVAQFLGVVGGELAPATMHTQLRTWVQRGLGTEGAMEVMEVLYAAGVEIGASDALLASLDKYRREFSLGYERARHAETLTQQDQMQRGLYVTLEKQIASEREARAALVRRQSQLETAADLARVTGSLHDLNDLLATACRHLRERLDLAFVAVYLLDDFKQWAILRAGAGEAGATLLERGYQLKLEEALALTEAISESRPVLLREGLTPAQGQGRPLMPITASSAVVALNVRGTALGFWTAHSDSPNAFTAQDAPVLTLIGDNLAYAIENANLLARAQASVQEMERAERGYVRDTWATQALQTEVIYSQKLDAFEAGDSSSQGVSLPQSNGDASQGTLHVPITLRGQVIGTVDLFDVTQPRSWSKKEKALASSVVEQMALAVENARLFEQAQRRAQETAIINEMARELSGELDQTKLFGTVYRFLPRLMPCEAFVVWFYDALTHTTTRPVLYDLGVVYPASMTPSPPSARLSRVLETNSPIALNLTRQELDEVRRNTPDIFGSSEPSASLLYVPLRVGNQIRGFMSAQSYQLNAYADEHSALLTSVGNYIATALENAQLFGATKQALSETQLLYTTGAQLNQVTSLEELVRIAAQPAFTEGAGSAQLLLMEYRGQETPVAADVVVSLVSPGVRTPLSPYTHFEIEEFALGKVMLANPRELVLIENVETSQVLDEATRGVLLASKDRAVVLLPLTVEERVLGAIAIGWDEVHAFGAQEKRIYQALASQLALVLNNRLLLQQTQDALAETQTLYEISARLNAANTTQEALEAAAGPAIVQGAFNASLLRVQVNADGEPTELEAAARWPRNSELLIPPGSRFPRNSMMGERSWIENPHEPMLSQDISQDPRVNEIARASYWKNGIRATALLPLKIGERWIGLLNFNWKEPRTFTPRDTRLFRSIMAQAATVLDNRALFDATQQALGKTRLALQQVQEAQDRLNLQYQTANILARATSLKDAAKHLLEHTCRSLNWQMGEYWTIDEQTNRLVLTETWSQDDAELLDFASESYGLTFTKGEGLVGRAWSEKQPIWVVDVTTDPGFRQTAKAHLAGLKSAFAFPLQTETRQFGVTVFFSTHAQVLDDTLRATMTGVGSQIGQFLERRRAEEAVRQQNTYLTALHDTTLGLMRRLDLDELLQNIITRAGELVGTEHGYVHLIEPGGSELRMRVGIGVYQDFVGTVVKPGQGLAGTVWQSGEPVAVDDYRTWSKRLPMVDRDVLRAVVGVPLKSGTQTVGVLGVATLEEGRRIGAAQIEALDRFAELAAVALDNAQLYNLSQKALQQTQRLAQREKASAEITDKLYAAPDVKAVLRTAAEELRRSTGSRRAVVRLNLSANGGAKTTHGTQTGNGEHQDNSPLAVPAPDVE